MSPFNNNIFVVTIGNGHRLKASDVVAHVLSVMGDNFARSCFVADLTSILLKDILQVRKYWCELSQNTWQGKLNLNSKTLISLLTININDLRDIENI